MERINYPWQKYDLKKFEKSNLTIALNVLYAKKDKIYPVYDSKYESNQEEQVIFSMNWNKVAWHSIAVKNLLNNF